ncbi:hypothetical protein ACLB2K_056074 [Fragaria x ananassa]
MNDCWSKHLPDELIEIIVKRLTLVDSIRFAAVCSLWRRVSSQWFQRVTRLPWLLKKTRFLDSETVNYSLYSPSEDTDYDLKFPSASRSNLIRCSGSIDGWLIMSEWTKKVTSYTTSINYFLNPITTSINYFLNPMTGDRIMLPQLTGSIPHSSTASSDPTNSDCIVAIAQCSQLVFCRPSSHGSWLSEGQRYNDIVFVQFHEDGKLYVMDSGRRDCHGIDYEVHVLVLVECEGKCKYEKLIVCPPAKVILRAMYSTPSFTWSSKGELFLASVRVELEEHDQLPELPIIQVLKTDDTSGCIPIWVNATNDVAQDQVLFLSAPHSTFISKPKSVMPTLDESFFALHSGKFFIHYWNGEETGSNLAYGVWFKPNISKVTEPTTNMLKESSDIGRLLEHDAHWSLDHNS